VLAALGTAALPALPNGVKDVLLTKGGVEVEISRGPGEVEPGAAHPIVERLEALRKALGPRYEFIAGMAFPHR
jgi:hypothetical protein